ncbi:MAG: hypothetical protein U5J83_14115 [Bryobacterales bacterium]|nr:hypothetical protein [Bryobacterales bacterium]
MPVRDGGSSPEALTRKLRIDAALRESGWHIVPHLPGKPFASYHHAAVTEFPTTNRRAPPSRQRSKVNSQPVHPAGYLSFPNRRTASAVQPTSPHSRHGNRTQAQRYARGIQQLGHRYGESGVPFLLSANGQTIRFLDARDPAVKAGDAATTASIRISFIAFCREFRKPPASGSAASGLESVPPLLHRLSSGWVLPCFRLPVSRTSALGPRCPVPSRRVAQSLL